MKTSWPIILLLSSLFFKLISCTGVQTNDANTKQAIPSALQIAQQIDSMQQVNNMTDSRDGETYAIVTIGKQTWMAENLRYHASPSWSNPNNPSTIYGRLYNGLTAETICPNGWHLPSDLEWSELEMVLGMDAADTAKTGWRGTHGTLMKSVRGWIERGEETNRLGFNAFPAGFHSSDGFDGLGHSTGYWSSTENCSEHQVPYLLSDKNDADCRKAWIRFIGSGSPYQGMNRFDDDKLSGWAISCRCVKN